MTLTDRLYIRRRTESSQGIFPVEGEKVGVLLIWVRGRGGEDLKGNEKIGKRNDLHKYHDA